jgi:predicted O-methyltransferase YrrM
MDQFSPLLRGGKTKIPTPLVMIDFFSDKLSLSSFRGRLAASVLNKKAKKCIQPIDHINLSFDIFRHVPLKYIGWPIAPGQVKQEIQTLLYILSERNIHAMLEIGTSLGGTLYLFTRVVDSSARIISLDLPGGNFGGGYEHFKIPFFTNFSRDNQKIYLVRADSHLPTSLSAVKSILKGQKLDFLFIDADHTYEGVKMDFLMYSPLVRKGGLIALHDIVKAPSELVGEVNRFWNETRHAHAHQEIINSPYQKTAGIGVIYT